MSEVEIRHIKRIRLIRDIPVASAHGLADGQEYGPDRLKAQPGRRRLGLEPKRGQNDDTLWVEGTRGIMIKLLPGEYEILEHDPSFELPDFDPKSLQEAQGQAEVEAEALAYKPGPLTLSQAAAQALEDQDHG